EVIGVLTAVRLNMRNLDLTQFHVIVLAAFRHGLSQLIRQSPDLRSVFALVHLPPRRGYLGFVLLLPRPPEPRPTRQPVPACPAPYAWLGAPQSSVCAWRICCMVGCLPSFIPSRSTGYSPPQWQC